MASIKFSLVNLSYLSFILLCYLSVFKTRADSSFVDPNDKSPLVEELRSKVSGLSLRSSLMTDKILSRYIEDNNYRVDRAVRQLTNTAKWRKAARADNLLNWTPSEALAYNLPYECTGSTEDGNPVWYIPFGRWNFTEVMDAGQGPELYNYGIRLLEDISNSTRDRYTQTGQQVDQAVVLVDASGYSVRSLLNLRTTSAILRIARAIDKHYPYLVKKWYVAKVGLAFRGLSTVASRVISRPHRKDFELFSSFDFRGTANKVLSHNIPASALPVELGGKAVLRYQSNNRQHTSITTITNNNINSDSIIIDNVNNRNNNNRNIAVQNPQINGNSKNSNSNSLNNNDNSNNNINSNSQNSASNAGYYTPYNNNNGQLNQYGLPRS